MFSLSLKTKKQFGVQKMLSKVVKTRTPVQCRSHHQKMIKKYGSIEAILKAFTQKTVSVERTEPKEN
jgi:hypothetical protein